MMAHLAIGEGPPLPLPYLADVMRDPSALVVLQKSAQVGATTALVALALWAADTGYAGRGNVLFCMPTQNQMDDFAQARFDALIQNSPYLRRRLQPEPPRRKGADSKRLKHLGQGFIFLRGADSRRQIASVDADLVILDEFDQMDPDVLVLAQKRLASSRAGRLVLASTPRLPESGIDALFRQSDQHRYVLPCPQCRDEQPLRWPDNVDVERAVVVCAVCRAPMDIRRRGRWVAQAPGNRVRGYHLSRLSSPWLNVTQLVAASEAPTLSGQQEFMNADLGEPFTHDGGGLSLAVLDRCRTAYRLEEYAGQRCVMGVDVGRHLHVVIRELPAGARTTPRALVRCGLRTVCRASRISIG